MRNERLTIPNGTFEALGGGKGRHEISDEELEKARKRVVDESLIKSGKKKPTRDNEVQQKDKYRILEDEG